MKALLEEPILLVGIFLVAFVALALTLLFGWGEFGFYASGIACMFILYTGWMIREVRRDPELEWRWSANRRRNSSRT